MNTDDNQVAAPIVKLATAWGAVGITSWADVASAMAALYTLLLIGEWAWKKFRPRSRTSRAGD